MDLWDYNYLGSCSFQKRLFFEEIYNGYGIQNFLEVDSHLGSKQNLKDLVKEAHKQGIYVILDIILNHTGNFFEYALSDPKYSGSEYDGILPLELMTMNSFSCKGQIVNCEVYPEYLLENFFALFKNSELSEDVQYQWYKDKVVTSLDDHDMVTLHNGKKRFCADKSSEKFLVNVLLLNLLSPGIPFIYYRTE